MKQAIFWLANPERSDPTSQLNMLRSFQRVSIACAALLLSTALNGEPTTQPTTKPIVATPAVTSTSPVEALELIRADEILNDVKFLASDDMNGRSSTSEEGWLAAEWIAEQFEAAGLEMMAPNRKADAS